MEVTIAIPFWGNHPAYRAFLTTWFDHYRASGCRAHVILVSDEELPADLVPECQRLIVDTRPFRDLVDPEYAYDRKGAIVCAAALAMSDIAILVLDADAYLIGDPIALLASFTDNAMAMPQDEGAFGKPYLPPFGKVVRCCAGVIFFGAKSSAVRQAIVAEYRTQFCGLKQAIERGTFEEERRLLEQHAWTFVAHAIGAPILPRELNWPVCFKSSGINPNAAIHHHIGRKKWTGHGRPPAGVLNARQVELMDSAGGVA